jgi:endonuclease/exonuclease/phosphatase (EEP) superfamily protein YafD
VWVYLGLLLTIAWAILWGGDHWWFPTIMMFGPKWIYAVPLPILIIWLTIARAKRRDWLMLLVVIGILLFPICRFCLPWRTLIASGPADVRVLTLNAGGDLLNNELLKALITDAHPDIVCLQECPEDITNVFPETWTILRSGGILIATPWDCETREVINRQHPPTRWPSPVCHVVQVYQGIESFQFASLHLQSPRYGLAAVTDSETMLAPSRRELLKEQTNSRREESIQVSQGLADVVSPLLIAGDFNTPTSSAIYRRCWGRYRNAFSTAGWGIGQTVRVCQGGIRFASRIDHILSTQHWVCRECWVGPDVGSDHLPVIASFELRD